MRAQLVGCCSSCGSSQEKREQEEQRRQHEEEERKQKEAVRSFSKGPFRFNLEPTLAHL